MDAKICDCCKKVTSEGFQIALKVTQVQYIWGKVNTAEEIKDLCPDCYTKLMGVLGEKRNLDRRATRPDLGGQDLKNVREGMRRYQCHKIVTAMPMSKNEFNNDINHCKVEKDDEEGYMVRYADGYVSWSPKKAFEEGYTEID